MVWPEFRAAFMFMCNLANFSFCKITVLKMPKLNINSKIAQPIEHSSSGFLFIHYCLNRLMPFNIKRDELTLSSKSRAYCFPPNNVLANILCAEIMLAATPPQ